MTQKDRSARAYLKRKHHAQAELAGAEILDPTLVAIDPSDGHYVVRTYDGETLHLVLREKVARPTPESAPVDEVAAHRQKKVYAPKSWPATNWNALVEDIREKEGRLTKETVKQAYRKFQGITEKMISHADAVLDNLPDVPDWADHLPLATES